MDVGAVFEFLQTPRAGGISIFVGTTREWTNQQQTRSLIYESYEAMALKEMGRIMEEAQRQWPLHRGCLLHRLGEVPITDASVVAGVATAHRPEAFEACRFLIDRLKVQVPIWKQECLADGRKLWVEGTNPPEVP